MLKVSSLVGFAAALIATPLLGSPAWSLAASCVSGTEASYEALGTTGCSVGQLTFFNIEITLSSLNGGVIGALAIDPFNQFGEFGLKLTYIAQANAGSTDLTLSMGVIGPPPIVDAFASLTGSGNATLSEQIFNGLTGQQIGDIQLTANTSTTIFFPPTTQIFAVKDQTGFPGSTTSVLIDAFSVPGPIVGAGLPGLVAACGGLLALVRRRRQQMA
jgi:hypothetical protein